MFPLAACRPKGLVAPGFPSWLPLGTGSVVPLVYADFAVGNYWYSLASYASFSAWMTAIGGVFSRASSATYFDSAGVLQTATSNVARFAYDPVSHAALGLRLTGARTNLALRSQQFDNASWSKSRSSVTADAVATPDGTTTADKMVEDGTSGNHVLLQVLNPGSVNSYTWSVYAKAAERTKILLRLYDGDAASYDGVTSFDLSLGSIISTTAGTATIQAVGNGWYRCSVTATISGAGSEIHVRLLDASGAESYAGDGVSGAYVWGAQLELGSFASDYVATVAASATEAADSDITGPTGGVPLTGFSATTGTLFVRGKLDDATAHALVQLDDNSANNIISLRNGAFLVASGGVTQANITRSADTSDDRLMAAWAANDFSFAVNGSSVGTDVSGSIPTVDRMRLMATTAANSFGNLKQFGYWPSRLSDADLARIAA